jgi:peptidoglycan/LPS O-acetylase OafA/YrhL
VIGVASGLYYLRHEDRVSGAGRRPVMITVVVTALVVAVLSSPYQLPYPLLHSGLLAPVFGLLIVALATDRGPIAAVLRTRPLTFLGQASYSLYLLHEPLSNLFYKQNRSPLHSLPGEERFWIYLAVGIGISSAVLVWYEEPIRRWLRGAARARSHRPLDQEGVPRPVTAEPQL